MIAGGEGWAFKALSPATAPFVNPGGLSNPSHGGFRWVVALRSLSIFPAWTQQRAENGFCVNKCRDISNSTHNLLNTRKCCLWQAQQSVKYQDAYLVIGKCCFVKSGIIDSKIDWKLENATVLYKSRGYWLKHNFINWELLPCISRNYWFENYFKIGKGLSLRAQTVASSKRNKITVITEGPERLHRQHVCQGSSA